MYETCLDTAFKKTNITKCYLFNKKREKSVLVDTEFCQRRRFWYEIQVENKTNYRRQHLSSCLCFLSYKNPLDGTSKPDLPFLLYFLRSYVLFQRKAAGCTACGLKHEEIFSVTPSTPAQSLRASASLWAFTLTFIIPSHLSSFLQEHGSAAKERACHSNANVWDTSLVIYPLESQELA